MILFYTLLVCVVFVRGQVNTRVSELEINSAVTSDNLIVISGLNVYRDELVVLDTYSGVITVRTESMSVEREYFDKTNITHVHSTVDDDAGVVALCTNKRGRCQYMNITTLSVQGYGDNLILEGEQEEEVDVGVLVLLANTNTNIPSLFTASGNAATIGESDINPKYPIRTAQLRSPLSETANLVGQAQISTFARLFKAIFKSGGYVYIVSEDSWTDIRVTRICESDSLLDNSFHSLYQTTFTPCVLSSILKIIDVRLEVLADGMESNYVIVTFESHHIMYVCAYSLSSINQAIIDTYQHCVVNGIGNIPEVLLFSVPSNSPCSDYSSATHITECNLWPTGQSFNRDFLETSDIGGTLITRLQSSSALLTVTSTTDKSDTFYYMYIVNGNYIDKYLMNGLSLIEPALEIITFSERITALQKDKSGKNIYATTNSRLLKIPVSDCERHPTCMQCVSDRDPLCGWCSIASTCNRMSLCTNSDLVHRWIDDDVTQCTSVNDVTPDIASINIQTNVTILAYNLPQLSEYEMYQCVFSSYESDYRTSLISVNEDSTNLRGPVNGTSDIVCQVPTELSLFNESDIRVYNISLSTNTSNSINIASVLIQAFAIVDCGYNTNCTTCIDSTSPCGWCLYNSRCVLDVDLCHMQEWIEPTENADRCPRVDSLISTSSLISALERTNITLLGSNLPPSTAVYEYFCILEFHGDTFEDTLTVPGNWYNVSETISQIECVISADSLSQEGLLSVQLEWGPSNYSIRQGYIEVSVYVCGNQADCYNCLLNPNCIWSTSLDNKAGECTNIRSSRMNVSIFQSTCPDPIITNFTPVSTAVGGILELQIDGYNLFVRHRETIVQVGDLNCNIFSQNSTVLVCYLETRNTVMASKINLTVNGVGIVTESYFTTRFPVITNVIPYYTPQYGGSNITIYGENLLIGASRTVGKTCDILETWTNDTDDMILCVTRKSTAISRALLTLSIDSVDISYTQEVFIVLEDPQVTNVYLAGYDTPHVTSVSGGLNYELRGSNLGATVTQILEFFSQDGRMISRSVCIPPSEITGSMLVCPGEKFSEDTVPLTGSAIRFELVMDSVPNITNPFFQVFEFTLIPDPVLSVGDENRPIMIMEGETRLIIEIMNIDRYPSQAIAIGRRLSDDTLDESICYYVAYSSEGISCELNYAETGQIELEILIGLNANKYVLYRSVQILPVDRIAAFFMKNTVVTITVCILVIIGIVLVLAVVSTCACVWWYYRVRTKKYNKMSKYLKLNVSGVEKEMVTSYVKGFSIMNDSELEDGMHFNETIPLLDFQTFAIRILFPKSRDHSVFHPLETPHAHNSANFTSALHKFESLLHDKQFVLAMVHSMEDNPNFNLHSRRDVASLLTISLFSTMPYLTEVLFDLLRELINRNVTRKTYKQLLERSESVVDMLLTDWLAFNLYSDLRGSTSVAIYSLFLRMKNHFESAPIDVITGNATNSLSEEKILRKDICYKILCVDIETADGRKMPCRLLDCYTITQTKTKMMDLLYRGIGFSQRPKLDEIDLELRFGGKAKLLRDNDMTNEEDEEWRRINTLSHYDVEDGMLLALVARTQNLNLGQVWDCPGTSIREYGISKRVPQFGEEGNKMYQLEKKESSDVVQKPKLSLRRSQHRPELFLPRLVATKRILQSSVDGLFEEMIPNIQSDSPDFDRTIRIPKVIKILFDFLDLQAALYDIQDEEVVHTWKSNSLALRFWVKLLKNPECLLDVAIGETQETALAVIAQAFIDGCTSGKSHATKESPTDKLLYNKEVQLFKARVKIYYEEVRNAPYVDRDALTIPTQEYIPQGDYTIFHTDSAVYELFNYAQSYRPEIWRRLCMQNMERQREVFRQVCFDIGDNLYGGEDSD